MFKFFVKLYISLLILNWLPAYCQKEGYNWTFGYKCGISFLNVDTPVTFTPETWNKEVNASISDSNGQLLMYLSDTRPASGNDMLNVFDFDNNLITRVKTYGSCTNCAAFVPYPKRKNLFYLFHIGEYLSPWDCPFGRCLNIFYTVIERNENVFNVIEENQLLLPSKIEEKLTIIKHANGIDSWLIVHGQRENLNYPCNDTFYSFLVKSDTITGPTITKIGIPHCDKYSYAGEIAVAQNGNLLSVADLGGKSVEVFSFDRCSGLLSNSKIVENSGSIAAYGTEFSLSGKYLYVSEGAEYMSYNALYQFDLESSNISGSRITIWSNPDSIIYAGQLQLAPNNKIYMAFGYGDLVFPNPIRNMYNSNAGVILLPDSFGLACDFRPFSFYLGDSSISYYGLPNIPNYNLGPTSIYEADAGEDTIICIEDSSTTGVFIGKAAIPGVSYLWHPVDGLDNPNASMPLANPSQTTMYVVTLTDTSIKYSCQTREDTVWVRVSSCDTVDTLAHPIIFPDAFTPNNDGSNDLFGPVAGVELLEFKIYNRWGQVVYDSPSKWDGTCKGKEQPMGTFIYYAIVQVENGERKKVSGVVSLLR